MSIRYSQIWFWYRCKFPLWKDWNIRYTRKGLFKLALLRLFKLATLTSLSIALIRLYHSKKKGVRFTDLLKTYKNILGIGALGVLEEVKSSILKRME
jgi:hypothetical protein